MKIFGIGIDIVQNNRIKNNILKNKNNTKNYLLKKEIKELINLIEDKFLNNNTKNLNEKLNFNLINKEFKEAFFYINIYFLLRIYTLNEIKNSLTKANIIEYFASRFAAKEACVKALKKGFGNGVSYKSVEIMQEENFPKIILHEPLIKEFNKNTIHLSISHEKNYSTAIVIVEN
ncbi:MAG: holo-ACP synthase [Spirochaetes bacterium]|nr:holo-ACP synthase [Spirochaetota bacterium]